MTDEMNEFTQSFSRLTQLMVDRCDQLEQRITQMQGSVNNVDTSSAKGKDLFKIQELSSQQLGPLYALLQDDSIGDILINSPDSVYIERGGKLEKTDVTFESDDQLLEIAENIALAAGKEFDRDRPFLDTRLIDGSRLNIVAPPLSLDGIAMSIRKFPAQRIGLQELVGFGSMTENMAEFLRICARSRMNILVVGGTGSGKTTMLNSIARHIAPDERVVTIEDAAELRLPIEHKVRLETKQRKANAPEHHEVGIRDLIVNALRMRPDRIIVGETRGGEAYDMIQAMNTGHEGSMTTIHANSPRDALMRLESMINIGVPTMSSLAVKQRMSSALDLIVMVARMDDGSRKITHITEINGMEGEVIAAQDLFKFEEGELDANGKVTGKFTHPNIMPAFAKRCFKFGFKEKMNEIFGFGLAGGITQKPMSNTPQQPQQQASTGFGNNPSPAPSGGGFGFFGKSPKN